MFCLHGAIIAHVDIPFRSCKSAWRVEGEWWNKFAASVLYQHICIICAFFGYRFPLLLLLHGLPFPLLTSHPPGESLIEPMICRQIVLHYYIYDDTIEIHEPKAVNSGLPQGGFFRRGKVNKKDGSPVSLTDLIPGNKLSILGQVSSLSLMVLSGPQTVDVWHGTRTCDLLLDPHLTSPCRR